MSLAQQEEEGSRYGGREEGGGISCSSMGRHGSKGLGWSPGSGGDPAGRAHKMLTAEQSKGSPQPPAAEVPHLPDAARQMKSEASKQIPMKMDGERQAAL